MNSVVYDPAPVDVDPNYNKCVVNLPADSELHDNDPKKDEASKANPLPMNDIKIGKDRYYVSEMNLWHSSIYGTVSTVNAATFGIGTSVAVLSIAGVYAGLIRTHQTERSSDFESVYQQPTDGTSIDYSKGIRFFLDEKDQVQMDELAGPHFTGNTDPKSEHLLNDLPEVE